MEEWPDPFSQIFAAIASETEQLLQAIAKEATEAVEQLGLVSETIADQVEQAIVPEIELLVDQANQAMEPLGELINPALEAVADQINQVSESLFEIWPLDLELTSNPLDIPENDWFSPLDLPENQSEDLRFPLQPLTCVGCRNYHGQVYGDTLLVCAIHPYGPDSAECSDWEST